MFLVYNYLGKTAKFKAVYFTMDFPPFMYFRPFWM